MEDFDKNYNDNEVIELVLMNEDLCFHRAEFPNPRGDWKGIRAMVDSFPQPTWSFTPASKDRELQANVWCPICNHRYDEASLRLKTNLEAQLEAHYAKMKGESNEV